MSLRKFSAGSFAARLGCVRRSSCSSRRFSAPLNRIGSKTAFLFRTFGQAHLLSSIDEEASALTGFVSSVF